MTKGLFHGAAMQSSVPAACELQTLAEVERGTGARVVKAAGCDQAGDVAGCLRTKSVEEIVSAVPGTFGIFPRIYGPNVDGHVFPDQPIKLIAAKRHHAMPAIVGGTADETIEFVNAAGPVTDEATYAGAVGKVFGAAARDAILARYPAGSYEAPRRAFVQLTTDAFFTCVSRRVASALAAAQAQPVYRYHFTHLLENDPAESANGSVHTVEHPYFFAWRGEVPSERGGSRGPGCSRRLLDAHGQGRRPERRWRPELAGGREGRGLLPGDREACRRRPRSGCRPVRFLGRGRASLASSLTGRAQEDAQHSRGVAAEPVGRARLLLSLGRVSFRSLEWRASRRRR